MTNGGAQPVQLDEQTQASRRASDGIDIGQSVRSASRISRLFDEAARDRGALLSPA